MKTPQAWTAEQLAKLVLLVLVGLAVYAGARQVLAWRDAAHANAAAVDQRDRTAQATTDTAADLATTTAEQARVEVTVHTDTAKLARDLEALRRANPDVAHWAAVPVPRQLRELARERRLARERLGGAAPGGGATDPGTPAAGPSPPY